MWRKLIVLVLVTVAVLLLVPLTSLHIEIGRASMAPPQSFADRHWRVIAGARALVVIGVAAWIAYRIVRAHRISN